MATTPNYSRFQTDFTKPNDEFATLQNVEFKLRQSDGDFADPKKVAIKKRLGIAQHGDQIHATNNVHSQFYYRGTSVDLLLAFSGTSMNKRLVATTTSQVTTSSTTIDVDDTTGFTASGTVTINGDQFTYTGTTATSFTGVSGLGTTHAIGSEIIQWSAVTSALTNAVTTGVAMQSYGGTPTIAITDVDEYFSGTWTGDPTYTTNAGTTEFPDTGAGFPTDESLIGWFVYPNTDDDAYSGNSYTIVAHTATGITVAGDASNAAASGKSYKIKPPEASTVLLDVSQTWTEDAYQGDWVVIVSGKGLGQARRIATNYERYLEIILPWDITPDGTSDYAIYSDDNTDNIFYFSNGTDVLQRFDGTTLTELTDRPKGNIIDSFNTRLIVAGDPDNPYTLYYSQLDNPEYFDPTFVIRPRGSDQITAHAVWQDKGVIFKESSVWTYSFVYNTTTSNYDVALERVPDATGCVGPLAHTSVENEEWYFDGNEVVALGAADFQIGVLRTKSVSFPINEILKSVTAEQAAGAVMFNDGRKVRFSIPDADLYFIYDINYKAWSTNTGTIFSSFAVDNKGIWYGGDSDTGTVYELDVDDHYADGGVPGRTAGSGGTAINMVVTSKGLDFGSRSIYKTYRYVDFIFEDSSTSFTYAFTLYTTKHTLTYSENLAVSTGASGSGELFGEPEFGETMFGGAPAAPILSRWRLSVPADPAPYGIIEVSNNTVDENLTLVGLEVTWKARSFKRYPNENIR